MYNWAKQVPCLAILGTICAATPAYANTAQVDLVTTTEQKNLSVVFNFDIEPVDVVLISPSGERFNKNSNNVEYIENDLKLTFTVKNAEIGQWTAEYDSLSNNIIRCHVMSESDKYKLWIQQFDVNRIDDTHIKFNFVADSAVMDLNYIYEIQALNPTVSGNAISLVMGNAVTSQPQEITADISSLPTDTYIYQMSIHGQENDFELADSVQSNPMQVINNESSLIAMDYDVNVDIDDITCYIEWGSMVDKNPSEYYLRVTADGNIISDSSLTPEFESFQVVFPRDTQKLDIVMKAKIEDMWTEEKRNEFFLPNESEKRAASIEQIDEQIESKLLTTDDISIAPESQEQQIEDTIPETSLITETESFATITDPVPSFVVRNKIIYKIVICGFVICGLGAYITWTRKK